MKKIILSVAALALFAGCAQNEAGPVNPSAPDLISFSPNTTRGEITTIGSAGFTTGGAGFSVWATANDEPGWYEDIENMVHANTGGIWNFKPTAISWPATTPPAGRDSYYPMHFYAVYPNTTAGLTGFTPAAGPGTDDAGSPPVGQNDQTLSFTYTVQATKFDQIDLLGAKATTNAKPANANLSISFNHLLSKINFGVKIETGMTLHVQGLTVNYVGNQGTYTFTNGTSGYTPTWTTLPSSFGQSYAYCGKIFAETDINNPMRTSTIDFGEIAITGNDATKSLFTVADSIKVQNLFLMPQQADGNNSTTNRSLTITSGKLDETLPLGASTGKTYVVMMYRLNHTNERLVGYDNARDHPAYVDPATSVVNGPQSPLFVKAAFPLTLKWDPGKGYLYVIPFNTLSASGGFLIDEYYYDECGNRTALKVGDVLGDGISQGPYLKDPILKNDGNIHLIPIVRDWDGTAGETVIP